MLRRGLVALAVLLAAAVAWLAVSRPRTSPAPRAAAPPAASVLLITIDTLRADAVGAYGAVAARTPALDSLARQGVLYERAFAAAPITLTSHATLLTGLYPPGHGARHNGIAMRAGAASLAGAFTAAGARTAAFVSAFPLDRSFGLSRGFELYSDRMPRGPDGRLANERPGRETVGEAIAWIRAHPRERFFAWVHLFEPHAPYGDAGDGRPSRDRYADEVAEADRQVARLLDALGPRRAGTAIVAAGDHGEAFGEHGEIAHSVFVYDTTLRVPLVIAGPGVVARRESAPVSLADVAPTLASLAGLKRWDADGIDLRVAEPRVGEARRAGWFYSESFAPLVDFGWSSLRSLRSRRWKYIAAPRPELYDVETDPAELSNVIDREPAVAADLAARVERISGAELAAAPASVDPDARRRLQALGYASGTRAGTAAAARRDPKDARELAAAIAAVLSGELRGGALERALQSILAADPDNPQANVRLAYLRLEAGRCDEAEPLFVRAIAGGLAGADAHLGRATCLGRRRAAADALETLEEARAREPQNPIVLANIGIARTALGDQAGAAAALREALAIDPGLHEARFHLALAYARSGDRRAARREAQALLERLPPRAPQRAEVERLVRTLQ